MGLGAVAAGAVLVAVISALPVDDTERLCDGGPPAQVALDYAFEEPPVLEPERESLDEAFARHVKDPAERQEFDRKIEGERARLWNPSTRVGFRFQRVGAGWLLSETLSCL